MAHALLPDPKCLKLDLVAVAGDIILIKASTNNQTVHCPRCATLATRVHSRYGRKLLDLPWQGNTVRLHLTCKKLRCDNKNCSGRIFAEPIPTVAARYAHKTARLEHVLRQLALTAGGKPAALLTQLLGFATSPAALLRRAKSKKTNKIVTLNDNLPLVRVLGVDDFAFKKGHRYGTILVDLEKRKPIDLLPDRESATLARWLEAHPGIEIVTRDRASCYAEGIRQGAPQATQVADRWHLLKNLGDALERLTHRHHAVLKEATKSVRQTAQAALAQETGRAPDPQESVMESENRVAESPKQDKSPKRQRREAILEQVKQLQSAGVSLREIARQMGIARNTVIKLAHCESLPEHAGRSRGSSKLQPYLAHLRCRWAQGEHNALVLHREILAKGFSGSVALVQRQVKPWREKPRCRVAQIQVVALSPRRAAWLLTSEDKRLETKTEERALLDCLVASSPPLASARVLALEFCRIVRERDLASFASWRESAKASGVEELVRFVTSLEQDLSAVESGLSLSWSNGQVEGQVNRLKVLKRQMYGRGSFELLRARVLHRQTD